MRATSSKNTQALPPVPEQVQRGSAAASIEVSSWMWLAGEVGVGEVSDGKETRALAL